MAEENGLTQLCLWVKSQQGKGQGFLLLITSFLEGHGDKLTPFETATMTQLAAFLQGRYIDTSTARDGLKLSKIDRLRLAVAWLITSQLSNDEDVASLMQQIKLE